MPTELEFYHVKLAIAKGMFGYKAITDAQFAKCHAAALNVFEALGTPAYQYDDWFMGNKLAFTYFDSGKSYVYRHEIRTAIDMFVTGFCDELWCGPALGLVHRKDGYTLLVDDVKFDTIDNDDAINMFVTRIGERYEDLSRTS